MNGVELVARIDAANSERRELALQAWLRAQRRPAGSEIVLAAVATARRTLFDHDAIARWIVLYDHIELGCPAAENALLGHTAGTLAPRAEFAWLTGPMLIATSGHPFLDDRGWANLWVELTEVEGPMAAAATIDDLFYDRRR